MSYADRISTFNQSIADAKAHADNIAGQIENLKAINRDPTKSLFNKINDSVGTTSGTIGQAAQLYHTYKHGKVLTFLEKHEVNQALGKGGNGGLKNGGNELLNTIDQARNAPKGGLAPNSESLQLPKANELVSSLKGRLIGNETQAATKSDLGQLVGRTEALPAKADNLGQDAVNKALTTATSKPEADNPFGFFNMFPEEKAAQAAADTQKTGTAIKQTATGTKLFTPEGVSDTRAGASNLTDDARQTLAQTLTQQPETEVRPLQNQILRDATDQLQPIKLNLQATNTNAISGGSKIVDNVAAGAGKIEGEVSNAGKIAGKIGDSIGSTLGKMSGEGGGEMLGNTIATGMEAVAPETGALAPLVAAVGGLVALGSSIAGMFHKNKPPPPVKAAAPPAAAQVGADLSVVK